MTNHVAVGGTFDLFHKGHKDFLRLAFDSAKEITVGVTGNKFAKSLDKMPFDSASLRLKNVENYLKKISNGRHFLILPIDDIFGTAVVDKTIDSIAVTENTYDGALRINRKRAGKNMKPLKIRLIPLTLASDGRVISSTRIRKGEISAEGLNYLSYLTSFEISKLTAGLRKELAKPQGRLHRNIESLKKEGGSPDKLISVGDQITFNLLAARMIPKLAIVDLKVERKRKFNDLSDLGFTSDQKHFRSTNPAGSITCDLVMNIGKILNKESKTRVILIDGEEDLAVLPAVLLSPLGVTVVYGQRDEGFVTIRVDLESKGRFLKFFNNFKR